ncbi:MAG: PAS domain S-box protein, partial [Bacteroidales bacterium]|nr:PAS domain S-box protein [Bacteroidales bacterium]
MEAVDQVLYNSYVKNFEKYPYPICLLDLDKIIYLNQECKSLLDLNTSDINLSIVNFIHDDYKVLIQNRLKNRKLGLSVPAQLEIKLHTPKKSVFVSVFTLDFPIGIHKYTHVVFGKLNDVQAQKIMHIPDENTNIISNLNFLNTLIDTIPNPIYYKNLEGIYIGCNQAFVDFMGVGKEKLLGKLPSEVPPVILANIYHDGDMSLIKKNDSETYEGKSRDISGEIKDIIYHKTVFFDSKNVVGGMVCTLVDITKHKQAKKALKESEVRVKLALEASMLGLWDFNLSKHEIYLSPEYYIILGYAPNDFFFKIEEWLTSFYDSNNNPIELLNGPFNTIRDKIDGKEYKVKTKEGGFKWVLLKGKIVEHRYAKYDYRITGTIRDISAQKEAELAVQESEMRFRSVLEASNDAIVVLLNNNDLVYWNKKAAILFATNQEELSNSGGFKQLFEKSEWLKLQKLLDEIVSTSTELSFESTMFSINGLQVPVLITITPIEIKRKLNLVLTIKDLTAKIKAIEEKKKLEEQLRHAQKMETIGTLAGGIAHDFNNILTPILGYTQMAMSDLDEESPIFEDLGHVYKAATRARDLVKQILTFSRRIETEKVNVYVHLIINEVLGLILATLPANIKIEKNIHSKMAIVNIAPTQLHQVIMNMCTNAYQSMKENGGVLTIDLEVVDNLGDLEKGESTLT